jgi:hypothetical protein
MGNGLVIGRVDDCQEIVDAGKAYCVTTLQPNSEISLFTASSRSGSLCRVWLPSGVNELAGCRSA